MRVQIPVGRGYLEEAAHFKPYGIPSMCGGDAAFCQITLPLVVTFSLSNLRSVCILVSLNVHFHVSYSVPFRS